MGLTPGAPSATQLAEMERQVARGLDEGAFGLSTGLIYPPGMYSPTEELVALAAIVAERDGLFTSHVRGSSETLLPATGELIRIAETTGCRVHHSHLEAVGRDYWPDVTRVLALEDQARSKGLRITHDVFPYTRAATMMAAIFPPWSLEGGVPALLERLGDPAQRRRIKHEILAVKPEWPPWQPGGWPHNLVGAVGWDGILVASLGSGENKGSDENEGRGENDRLVGRSLAAIAEESGRDPFDVVADLMIAERGQVGQQVAEISGSDEELAVLLSILSHPQAAVISDAEDYGRGAPHPAHAGAFARALRLNRQRELMPLHELTRRMTSHPAAIVGLRERGRVIVGGPADLTIFDPQTVEDRASWEDPRAVAAGVRWVTINGRVAVDEGRYAGGSFGTVLRKGE